MLALWRLQLTKPDIIFSILLLIAALVWTWFDQQVIKLPFFIMLLPLLLASRPIFLMHNKMYLLLHTLPIAKPLLLKSLFSYAYGWIVLLTLAVLPFQILLDKQNTDAHFAIILLSIAFSVSVTATAIQLYFILTDESFSISTTTTTLSVVLSLLCIIVFQLIVGLVFSTSLVISVLLAPFISSLVFLLIMDMTIRDYMLREFYD